MILRDLVKSVSSILPFGVLMRAVNPQLVSVFYHAVSENPMPHVKHLYPVPSPSQFAKDIDFLLKHFTPIDVKDFVVCNGSAQKSKPKLLLSFDDGFSELSSVVAPTLLSKGIPATFFVTPAFIDNREMLYRCKQSLVVERIFRGDRPFAVPRSAIPYFKDFSASPSKFIKWFWTLNYSNGNLIADIAQEVGVDINGYLRDQKPYLTLNELSNLSNQGFTIGAHSLDHPNFCDISIDQQIFQVESSLKWICDNIPNQPNLFAFPFTNDGVSPQLYRYFIKENPHLLSLLFGTAGYKPATTARLIHRIPMEVENKWAKPIIKGEFFYYLAKRIVGSHIAQIPL
ncbi:MAG: polysaccharide deacetylase family protein [Tenuifilaceae bacterium]|jgi:peptidoglycan/xylan/chitin deacetylase (PgdA/CDA1 family)|nr:polysaccharide deacetylase family protein [Tenuifilaceae bacterium]